MKSGSVAGFGNAIGWNLVGSVARIAATLVCQLLLLRLLGPVPAGQFAIFLFIVGIGSILAEGGMTVTLARAHEPDTALLRAALFVILCYATLATAGLLAFTGVFVHLFRLPGGLTYVPVVAALNVIPLGLSSVSLGLLKRQHRARDVQLIQLGGYLLGFAVVALPIAFLRPSVDALVAAFTVQTLTTLVAAIAISGCPLLPHWRGARTIQGVSARSLFANGAFFISESAPSVLTAHLIGARAVGLYSTAFNLLRTPTDTVVGALYSPLLVATARDTDHAVARARFMSTLNVLATVMLAVFVVVGLCGNQVVGALLGAKWHDAGPVMAVVALVMAARLFGGVSGAVLWGTGRLTPDLTAQCIGVIGMLAGFALLRPNDVVGVAWVVFGSVALRSTIQLVAAVRALAISLPAMARSLGGAALMTVGLMMPMYWIGPALADGRGLLGFLMLGVAAATLLALRIAVAVWRSPHDWAILVRGRLRKRTPVMIDPNRSVLPIAAVSVLSDNSRES